MVRQVSSYNDGADIVPLDVANVALQVLAGLNAKIPDNYNRVQRLTEDGIKRLVFEAHDRDYIIYGELSGDFPLCADFASIAAGDVLRGAVKDGLAVRPFFGTLYYTKSKGRHAINFAGLQDGRVLFFEPQTDQWLSQPEDCKSMDEFRIL